jgi:hypothetical protein
MKVIKPVTYTGAMLISTTAANADAEYNAGTSYSTGNRVTYLETVYESLVSSNVGNTPSTSPTQWVEIGPSNKRAMFDSQVSTQTTRATPLAVTVAPGTAFNSLALLNMSGTALSITVTDGPGGPTVYSQTISLIEDFAVDWYMYFFEPTALRSDVVLTDIPPYSAGRISVSLSAGSGDVAIGSMMFGTFYELGGTEYGAGAGIRDYSVKETDEFGVTTFVQRAFSKRMEAQVFVENDRLGFITRILSELRATPSVWIGADDDRFSPLVMFGFYRDFNIDIAYPAHSLCRLEIEGLI